MENNSKETVTVVDEVDLVGSLNNGTYALEALKEYFEMLGDKEEAVQYERFYQFSAVVDGILNQIYRVTDGAIPRYNINKCLLKETR